MAAGLVFINFSLMSGVMPKAGHQAMKGICRLIRGSAAFRTYTEKCPDKAQGSYNIVGIDFPAFAVGRFFATA
jgi:hypothetical protein